ncbi:PH domain-containing protein [Pyxidicoccus xibeiensis]|uniref:PH domain-containing protein n=1 Tax=Pyxidicoccus xibeiensis TaxID=2906759 RepID=UPI0020A730AF|nr:PH domain-containing protein [Pyxidicoccus xibeiensis]MCP3136219.1 PH domain-containing protein [Pyxidicoccus xibeiensis]
MAEPRHAWFLRLLKVPPEPQVPVGDAVRVFRSAPGYRRYRLLGWGMKQLGLVVGLLAGFMFLSAFGSPFDFRYADEIAWGLEAFAWLGFLAQLPLGFLVTWVDLNLRWYILSDRSLRIREGVVSLQEKTMTFANIQQVSIQQNPLQRLFGIADVKVETAGGGGSSGSSDADSRGGEHLHEAHFRGVDNAREIRDVILARVRQHRDAGLGEPSVVQAPAPDVSTAPDALAAARELLGEMRALRQALPSRRSRTPAE